MLHSLLVSFNLLYRSYKPLFTVVPKGRCCELHITEFSKFRYEGPPGGICR